MKNSQTIAAHSLDALFRGSLYIDYTLYTDYRALRAAPIAKARAAYRASQAAEHETTEKPFHTQQNNNHRSKSW